MLTSRSLTGGDVKFALPALAAPVQVSVVPFNTHWARARVGANIDIKPIAMIAARMSWEKRAVLDGPTAMLRGPEPAFDGCEEIKNIRPPKCNLQYRFYTIRSRDSAYTQIYDGS